MKNVTVLFFAALRDRANTGSFTMEIPLQTTVAARYGIDRLKQIIPVWKQEVGPDGKAWVEGDYLPTALGVRHGVTPAAR